MTSPFMGNPQFPAPRFPEGLDWLNVPAPLTIEALRGRVVIFDFWTYGCINCIHMIPVLEQIQDLHPDEVVVVSVHSAKFPNESALENLRQIVQRYGLEHPVVNDEDFEFWRLYGANAWPTFVVVDPRGNIAAMQAGEIPFESFNRYISGMVDTFRGLGELSDAPLERTLEGAGSPASALAFPGKVLADAPGNRLFIADSGHHRILIADLTTYEVRDVVGIGYSGFDDGDFALASFDKPQGMTLVGDTLYVADTENHAIRAVDLLTRTVTTVAGTGVQSYARDRSGVPLETPLISPWDVAYGDGVLFVAMAGAHQLWALLFDANQIGPIVGSGREGLLESAFADAALAQPSGIIYHDRTLYFADSESSSVRAADLRSRTTRTLAGPLLDDLFSFGDADGVVGISRLQHPLGVTLGDGDLLYVADTYNSRIRQIDLTSNTMTTVAGQGSPGAYRDGAFSEAAFDEPGGISYAGGRLYVADTNNHAVRVLDLAAQTVTTVHFPNPAALQIGERLTVVGGNRLQGELLRLPEQTVAPGAGEVVLRISLPEGYKINPLAPSSIEWNNAGDAVEIAELGRALPVTAPETRLPVTLREGEDTLSAMLLLYYCREGEESLCFIDHVTLEIPLRVGADASSSTVTVTREVQPPDIP